MITSLRNRLASLCLCLFAVSAVFGQNSAAELNITLGEQRVKFAPTRSFQEMRLEIVNSVGEIVFTYLTTDAEYEWNLRSGNGETLAPGLYRYVLALKFSDEVTRQHRGHFIVEEGQGRLWLTAQDGTEVSGTVLNTTRAGGRSIAGVRRGEDGTTNRSVTDRTLASESPNQTGGEVKEAAKAAPLTVIPDDLTVNGSITLTPGVADIKMTGNTGGLRFYGAPTLDFVPQAAAIQFWGNGSGLPGQLYLDTGAHNNAALIFRSTTAGQAIQERMRVTATGLVGIGTNAPAAKLQVNGDIRSSALRQELTAQGTSNVINGFMGTGSGGVTPGNRVTAGVVGASIGGGGFNGTLNFPSTGNTTGDFTNRVTDWFGTVGGGVFNRAGDNTGALDSASFATVGGGTFNTASGSQATVGGGNTNTASGSNATVGGGSGNTVNGDAATVGGGIFNAASGNSATVGGGSGNTASGQTATVGGGSGNTASGQNATAGGGANNTASGNYATVPGGSDNTAIGSNSFAAGRQAKANHQGAFVWGDSTEADFASTANDQFLIRASGGVGIGTNTPSAPLYVQSDRNTATDNTVTFRNTAIGPSNPSHVHWGTTGDWYIRSASTSGKVLLQDTGGNVGIGTAAPADKLHVAGEVRVNNCVRNAGGTQIAGSCVSDRRYKRDITAFPNMLQQVTRLQPVNYFWRSSEFPTQHFDDKQSYGLIAQDVEAVLPELVETNADGYKAVNYSKLPLVTLQAVKELKSENDALKQQNEAFKQQSAQQQQMLNALQNRLLAIERVLVQSKRKPRRR